MRHLSQVTVIINEISLVNSNICHMWWLSIFMTCNIDHMRYLSDLIVIVTCNFSHEIFIKCYIYHMWYLPTYYMWYSLHEINFTSHWSQVIVITCDIVIVPNPINFPDNVCCSIYYFEIIKHLTPICQIWSWCNLFSKKLQDFKISSCIRSTTRFT